MPRIRVMPWLLAAALAAGCSKQPSEQVPSPELEVDAAASAGTSAWTEIPNARMPFPGVLTAGQPAERVYRAYIGPKEPDRLEAMGGGLRRSIDAGWSWISPLTRVFHWLLAALYSVIPNYGVAIIVLTILVRLVTAPLTNKQMRSMERMRSLSTRSCRS